MNDNSNDLQHQISVAAYFLSELNLTYDKLCWMLAKRQLLAQGDMRYREEQRVKEKAAEIYFSGPTYEVLCWLIAELDIKMKLGK
ncbi:MAG: hypothetical protein ACFE9I_03955 [Candidatus Hermodarchaeota archaeon]